MSTYLKLLQFLKAESPILVTLSGIITSVILSTPQKANFGIRVTVLGISIDVTRLSLRYSLLFDPLNICVTLLPKSIFRYSAISVIYSFFKLAQSLNALPPTNVKVFGIFILDKLEHPTNAQAPMLLTPSSIITLLILLSL